jgi:LAS superfamily LD-carboxypeptidase LdcB
MREPPRIKSLDSLADYVADRVRKVLAGMKKRGYDPVVFEAARSTERQIYLFGIGRFYLKNRKPVTMLNGTSNRSMHQRGKAVDIISKSRLWDWPQFYAALREEGAKVGLHSLHPFEECHLEWRG